MQTRLVEAIQSVAFAFLDALVAISPRHPGRWMLAGRYRIVLSHGLGGGSELNLRTTLLSDMGAGGTTVLATPRGRLVRIVAEGLPGSRRGLVSRRWLMDRLISQPASQVYVNGLPGWRPLRGILASLARLPAETEVICPVHDYFAVCPSFHLLDANMSYCGIPSEAVCSNCFPTVARAMRSEFRDVGEWRDAWAPVLQRANLIRAFSISSRDLLQRAYPRLAATVEAHRLPVPLRPPARSPERSSLPRVALFGAMTRVKGAYVLVEMARLAARRGLFIEWHVFGELHGPTPTATIKEHGSYSVPEMPSLLEEFNIGAAVLPSIVPETFSFVAEELVSMSVPFSAFPLGAPYERLRDNRLVFFAEETTPESLLEATLRAIEAGWDRSSQDVTDRSIEQAPQPVTGRGWEE